ncbi:unnamed protein product (macronuclear) [Paramecium tetraurelia]|uniref:Uncharacterized protein n=1 Tax=Paramecium tetraurelia TaxID=5888 RepID=A0C463_PARTE|nr:uncharacterized protein GSPATT00035060001 [Paramecium tetraurelia]CAK65580.1 unnamed protein product [Paramecium tetraurelia]|eukprot:XP_001432977.1 hypothetical protein (macronuclear) [Paramecium tetraurelia strain d4-2]
MNPKISRENYLSDYSLLDLSEDVIRVSYWKDYEGKIDPFTNNILLPLVVYANNNQLTEAQLIQNHTTTSFGDLYIPNMKFGFSYFDNQIFTTNEMYIEVVLCQEKYLKPNEKCASPELTEEFFAQLTI